MTGLVGRTPSPPTLSSFPHPDSQVSSQISTRLAIPDWMTSHRLQLHLPRSELIYPSANRSPLQRRPTQMAAYYSPA